MAEGTIGRISRAGVEAPLWRVMLAFTLPSLGSTILQTATTTVTSIYLGRLIGVEALAAVSAFFPFGFLLISFIFGLAMSSSVLIAQAYGAGEHERVQAVAGTSLTLAVLIGVVISLTGGVFAESILRAVHTPENILPDAVSYARVMLLFQPIVCCFLSYTTFLRGTGDSRTPFYALILNTAQTVLLTPAFIRGWFGLPALGVASGAAASIVAYVVTLVALGVYLHLIRHPLAPNRGLFRHLRIDFGILRKMLRIGLPTSVQMISNSISQIGLLTLVNGFGSVATAAYGAVNQVGSYVQMPAITVGLAASIFGAQAIGRGDQARLGKITRTGLTLSLTIGGIAVILVYSFASTILALFLTDRATLETAHRLLDISVWSYLIFGANSVLVGIMRASGTVIVPMVIAITCIWAVQVPAAYLLSHYVGLSGIWLSYPITFSATLLLQAAYFTLVWRHRKLERLI